jgi:hypothetical protein
MREPYRGLDDSEPRLKIDAREAVRSVKGDTALETKTLTAWVTAPPLTITTAGSEAMCLGPRFGDHRQVHAAHETFYSTVQR